MSGNVRLYANTRTASNINDADLFDVQIMEAGATQFEAAKMQFQELKKGINPYKFFGLTIEQADVRLLSSLNGGKGIELLPAIDDATTYDIINPVLIIDVGGSGFDTDDIFTINFDEESPLYRLTPDVTLTSNRIAVQSRFFADSNLYHSKKVWGKFQNPHPNFEGKIRIEFEYREVNIAIA